MEIVLISCVRKKKSTKCKANDLYDSTWFHYARSYAQSLNPDRVFILSAKYGLVDSETEIEPYEETLKTKSDREIRLWADMVLTSLRQKTDIDNDRFIILAGEKYRRYSLSCLGCGKAFGNHHNDTVRTCKWKWVSKGLGAGPAQC